jgi:competence protein ComEC
VRELTPPQLRVSFLDIGQGDAILIQTPSGHDMLIDGGPTDAVLERLHEKMSYFDRGLDVVIATHGDADHVTGLIPVLEQYDVKQFVRSSIEADTGIFDDLLSHVQREGAEVRIGKRGDVIDFGDGVVVYVLYPGATISPHTETNDASVSVVITYGQQSFLLTGDLSSKYEPSLIQAVLPKSVTVYKAGHHGSKYSSGEQLLTYIRPEYAVISAGADNKYGHPNPEAITRLQKYSKEILSTIDRGTITFETDGRMIEVRTGK